VYNHPRLRHATMAMAITFAMFAGLLVAAPGIWARGSSNRCHSTKACVPSSHRRARKHSIQAKGRSTRKKHPSRPHKAPSRGARRPTSKAPSWPVLGTPAPTTPTPTTATPTTPTTPAPTTPTTTTPTPQPPTVDPQATPFAPTSVWNQALSTDAPLDPNSQTYVSDLLAQLASDGTGINTYQYSTPVFTVPANQPTVTVTLDSSGNPSAAALQSSWDAVPVPSNAQAASGGDEQMVIWQPSTDQMWEFWEMQQEADGWHAQWGGTIDNVSSNPGYYTDWSGWGATATSLPLLGGLIRPSELAAGQIDHALAIGIPAAQAATFAWPAQRTDGSVSSSTAIPEGQRFRLDPSLDLSTIPMAPIVRMIAVAAQKYGIIVRDQAGDVTFYGEDSDAEGLPDPYDGAGGWFEGQYISNLLASFPWSHLEALQDTLS
jgi:hypothetical protein